jgi:hypothetical protein
MKTKNIANQTNKQDAKKTKEISYFIMLMSVIGQLASKGQPNSICSPQEMAAGTQTGKERNNHQILSNPWKI